jgi:extracellular factor (EF) 3-hydroxypalmitic acid methyl ester biosynthesis protein
MTTLYFQQIVKAYREQVCEISLNGPLPNDYEILMAFFIDIRRGRKEKAITDEEFFETRQWFNGAMNTTDTMQGHVCLKPRGYDGDFEIIDKIYREHHSSDRRNQRWDEFYHQGDAPRAVRNRKDFFIAELNQMKPGSKILNLACGPCRDIVEYARQNENHLEFHSIDIDLDALAFAGELLKSITSVTARFQKVNILRFMPQMKYDLIWSAGLFDYFNDTLFERLLERYVPFIAPGGKMIVGNFGTTNTSMPYMEYGNWFLNHRDEEQLLGLGSKFTKLSPVVRHEPLKVNLFLELN